MNTPDTPHSTYGRRCVLLWAGALGTVLGASAGIAGCGSVPPPPPPPTQLKLTLAAAADVNPDMRGRASPLLVRVYALKASSAFEAADFFALYDKDQQTLGTDLVRREELLLRPGESRALELTLPDEAAAVAFFAAYRDIEHARWRDVAAIQPHKQQALTLRLAARQMQLAR